MPNTSATEIIDLFMTLQSDYRLINLYQLSGSAVFTDYLESWLLFSINEFTPICSQTLTYSTTTQEFNAVLTQENILMLSQLMVRYWLMKEIQDVLQMNNNIQDHDFKQWSQAQNLTAKQQYYNSKKEEIEQMKNEYAYRKVDWTNWTNQIFWEA